MRDVAPISDVVQDELFAVGTACRLQFELAHRAQLEFSLTGWIRERKLELLGFGAVLSENSRLCNYNQQG